jgi:hypothetical protein
MPGQAQHSRRDQGSFGGKRRLSEDNDAEESDRDESRRRKDSRAVYMRYTRRAAVKGQDCAAPAAVLLGTIPSLLGNTRYPQVENICVRDL